MTVILKYLTISTFTNKQFTKKTHLWLPITVIHLYSCWYLILNVLKNGCFLEKKYYVLRISQPFISINPYVSRLSETIYWKIKTTARYKDFKTGIMCWNTGWCLNRTRWNWHEKGKAYPCSGRTKAVDDDDQFSSSQSHLLGHKLSILVT